MQSGWRRQLPSYACVLLLAVPLAFNAACGGDDDKGGSGGGGGGDQVPNGSRLGWTQSASSLQQLQSITYRIYVDGARMTLSNVTCGTQPTSAGYDCSGRLPTMTAGRRVLELASVLNGVESPRSAPLTITIVTSVTQSITPESSTSSEVAASDPPARSTVVCVANSRECFEARTVASSVENPSSFSPMSDGRLLFVENGTAVRVIEGDHLWTEPALLSPHPEGRIVGLAVDRSPGGDKAVFVAWTEPTSEGRRLNVTRYRELQNVLGEGATIVTGLPFTDHATAPLAVDGSGLVYIALPTATTSNSGGVLRFTRDGAIPPANSRLSPIIAEGYSQPSGMAIDTVNNRVWLAGVRANWPSPLATFLLTGEADASWPHRPRAALQLPRGAVERPAPTSLSLVSSTEPGGAGWLMVGSEGQLSRGTLTTDGRVEGFAPLHFEPSMSVHSVAQGPVNSWYLVSGADTSSTSILRMTAR